MAQALLACQRAVSGRARMQAVVTCGTTSSMAWMLSSPTPGFAAQRRFASDARDKPTYRPPQARPGSPPHNVARPTAANSPPSSSAGTAALSSITQAFSQTTAPRPSWIASRAPSGASPGATTSRPTIPPASASKQQIGSSLFGKDTKAAAPSPYAAPTLPQSPVPFPPARAGAGVHAGSQVRTPAAGATGVGTRGAAGVGYTAMPSTAAMAAPPTAAAASSSSAVDAFKRMREEFAKLRAARESKASEPGGAYGARTPGAASNPRPGASGYRFGSSSGHAAARPRTSVGVAGAANRVAAGLVTGARLSMFGRKTPKGGRMKRTGGMQVDRVVVISDDMTVKQLAVRMGIQMGRLLYKLDELGEGDLKAEDVIDPEVAEVIVSELRQKPKRTDTRRRDREPTVPPSPEEMAAKGYPHRPPVVTVMGHVDHGKTTLMDALRGTKVAEKEAGGITQNVAAFAVSMDAKAAIPAPAVVGAGDAPKATSTAAAKAASSASSASRAAAHVDIMTFLDTPGHALFASMRRRGTAVADIVVLVVDGKDGVMAQTKECIKIITDSGVPTVVAVTKCDVVESGPAVEKIAKQLMEYGIVCENFGGDVPIVGISAKSGMGLETLKEIICFQAEVLDLRAQPDAGGEAVVVDARVMKGSGVTVDCVVRWGTMKAGDVVVAGTEYGRVKALVTDSVCATALRKREGGSASKGAASAVDSLVDVPTAKPGMPVRIMGFRGVPGAGDSVLVVESEERAKAVIDGRLRKSKAQGMALAAASDSVKRGLDREEYQQRRARKAAYEAAIQRDRKRRGLRKAGLPIPYELELQPWELAILQDGREGKIHGMDAQGKKIRQQGGQQLEMSARPGATGVVGDAGKPVSAAAKPKAAAAGGKAGGVTPSMGPVSVAFITKADSAASLVALQDAIARIPNFTSEVLPRVVQSSVGELSEKDIQMAADMKAHVLCFNSKISQAVQKSAEKRQVTITTGKVIYHLLDEVCDLLAGYMQPIEKEENVSTAEIKAIFPLNSKGDKPVLVAGSVIVEGTFLKSTMTLYRVVRDGKGVADVPALASLMHFKDKVESVKKGGECGIVLDGFSEFLVGDKIVAIKLKSEKPKLEIRFD